MRSTILAVLAIICAGIVFAVPNGPSGFTIGESQRGAVEASPPSSTGAMAGNVTELSINSTSVTKNWQGYFGNISGKISLDDASNWTLYDWSLSNPNGRVYAARIGSVNWNNIGCLRFDANGSLYPNVTIEEGIMGAGATDADGLDETFATGLHPQLPIGSVLIPANTCNATTLYVNDSSQSASFHEVLLTDNSSNLSIVYTAVIEQNLYGFNNRTMDFEMLVSENGHGNSATTPYYFWVELE